MTIEIGVVIAASSLVIAVLGFRLNNLGYQLNKAKEMKTDNRENAEVKATLGHISKGVDDIRIDLKANEKRMITLGERITRVEESSKQAHRRIDNLEEKGN